MPIDDIDEGGEFDDGTMEEPLPSGGTLHSVPQPAHRAAGWRTAWTLALPMGVGLLAIGAFATTGDRAPRAREVTDLDRLGAWLAEHPGAQDDHHQVRVQYAEQLARAQRYPEAFEEYLTVVRRAPASPEGGSALRSAAWLAETLALAEGGDALWTERWVATVDRYARYWPGDPLTPLLVEETVHTLVARGQVDEAQGLTREHMYR